MSRKIVAFLSVALLTISCLATTAPVKAAQIGGKRAAVLSPFTGPVSWGNNAPNHDPAGVPSNSGFAWDLRGGASAAVYPRIVTGDGTLALNVTSITDNGQNSGKVVTVEVRVDNTFVGTVQYVHLTNLNVTTTGPVTSSTLLGYTAPDVNVTVNGTTCRGYQCSDRWDVHSTTGIHTHVNFSHACYGSFPDNSSVGASTGLALLSQNYTSATNKGECDATELASVAAGTPAPGPDADADGVPNASDVCTYQPGMSYLSGCVQQHAKLNGDFNGDGKADTAAFYRYPERGNAIGLFVWPGNGDGTFGGAQLAWYTPTGWDGTHVIVAGAGDFNGDGKTDVAAFYRYDDTTIRLFIWNGQADNTFTDPISRDYESGWEGAHTIPAGVGDFNGDGKLDVAAFYRYPERGNAIGLFTFTGNGNGTFNSAQLNWYTGTGWDGLHVVAAGAGDFNSDGKADVAAYYRYDDTSIRMFIWQGTSNGIYADPVIAYYGVGWEGYNLVPIGVGDFNGDGKADVATFYRYPERGNAVGLFVWYNNGNGTFGTPELPWYTATGWDGTHVISAGVGDFDHNGQSDITAFYEYPDTSVRMFEWKNEHWGSFADPSIQFYSTGWEGFHIMA